MTACYEPGRRPGLPPQLGQKPLRLHPREHTARQELPELALDEAGEAATLAAVADLAQEGFQVLADDAMENSALRGPALIGDDTHGHRASEARAVPGSVPKAALPPSTTRRCATGSRNAALRAESDRRRHGRRKRRTVVGRISTTSTTIPCTADGVCPACQSGTGGACAACGPCADPGTPIGCHPRDCGQCATAIRVRMPACLTPIVSTERLVGRSTPSDARRSPRPSPAPALPCAVDLGRAPAATGGAAARRSLQPRRPGVRTPWPRPRAGGRRRRRRHAPYSTRRGR